MISRPGRNIVSATLAVSTLAMVCDAGAAAAQSTQNGYPNSGYPSNGYQSNGYPSTNTPSNGYPTTSAPQNAPQSYPQGGQGQYGQGQYGQGQYGQDYGRQDGQARAGQAAPPPGQYAPPPAGYERPGAAYDDRAQAYDREYADRYSRWAAQYCIDRRNNNTAAGAVIGGVFGAILGSGLAGRGDRGAGALVGGALGAGTGAIIGNSSSAGPEGCPPGYYVRAGAPAFYYEGPGYVAAPAWYNPWVWSGGVWVYRPYRYWYFYQGGPYWRPGWRPGYFHYRYRHW